MTFISNKKYNTESKSKGCLQKNKDENDHQIRQRKSQREEREKERYKESYREGRRDKRERVKKERE